MLKERENVEKNTAGEVISLWIISRSFMCDFFSIFFVAFGFGFWFRWFSPFETKIWSVLCVSFIVSRSCRVFDKTFMGTLILILVLNLQRLGHQWFGISLTISTKL